jgi:hypothetical protein
MRKSLRSTLDKSTTAARQEIVSGVTEKYNFKPADVRAAMVTLRTTQTDLETGVTIKSSRPSLAYFKAKQISSGVVAQVRKGTSSFYKSAFIVNKWNKAMIRKGKNRLPIEHRAGPSITEIVDKEPLLDKVKAAFESAFDRLFGEEINKRRSA